MSVDLQQGKIVHLDDYMNPDGWLSFNPSIGEAEVHWGVGEGVASRPKTIGFGSTRQLGVLHPKPEFVAVYVRSNELVLSVAGREFILTDESVTAERKIQAPFVWRFRVLKNGREMFGVKYWFLEWREWPDNGDIFYAIQSVTESRESRLKQLYIWASSLESRDMNDPNFVAGLHEYLRRHGC